MKIEYHPAVEQDVAEALERYKGVSENLAREFKTEVSQIIRIAARKPGRFHLIKPGLHRANLKRFPYHVVYRELASGIRVILVRHHRRHPELGMERE